MSETALTDSQADALSGATDGEIDLTYPAIGQSTYYTTVYRLLHRLGLLGKVPGNSLRVFKDGQLTFGVRAGRFTDGTISRSYAGASAQALTDDATNYIYLSAAGTLAVNTTGFPNPAVTPHIPLAAIVAAGGSYDLDDIADCRGGAIFRAAVDRAALTQQDNAVYAVPLTRGTQMNGQPLPAAAQGDGGSLGLAAGTHGTNTPMLVGSAVSNAKATERARFQLALPPEYVAGESVTIRLRARVTAVLHVEAGMSLDTFKGDREGGVAGAGRTSGAVENNTTGWADLDVPVLAAGLVPGDLLDIELEATADDTGGAADGRIEIASVQLLLDVKG